jgi:type VI secretion system protein ImpK
MNYRQLATPRALVTEREQKNQLTKTAITSELAEMVRHIGLSELEDCCAPLLAIIIQLRRDQSSVDALSLKQSITEEIVSFEVTAKQKGIDDQKITAMRYVLCTVIDEFILNQQYQQSKNWNEKNDWSRQSLVVTFYNEAWGGEKFYEITEDFISHPRENVDFLSLILFFLNLGYEGKYRLIENGTDRLALLKEKIHHILASYNPINNDEPLSLRANIIPDHPRFFFSKQTLILISLVAFFGVVGCFFFYNSELNTTVMNMASSLNNFK